MEWGCFCEPHTSQMQQCGNWFLVTHVRFRGPQNQSYVGWDAFYGPPQEPCPHAVILSVITQACRHARLHAETCASAGTRQRSLQRPHSHGWGCIASSLSTICARRRSGAGVCTLWEAQAILWCSWFILCKSVAPVSRGCGFWGCVGSLRSFIQYADRMLRMAHLRTASADCAI